MPLAIITTSAITVNIIVIILVASRRGRTKNRTGFNAEASRASMAEALLNMARICKERGLKVMMVNAEATREQKRVVWREHYNEV